MNKQPLNGICAFLYRQGILDNAQAHQATEDAARKRITVIDHLIQNNLVDEQELATLSSKTFGLPLFDLSDINTDTIPQRMVSETLARQHMAFPIFQRHTTLYIAVADALNFQALRDIGLQSGFSVEAILIKYSQLSQLIDQQFETADEDIFSDLDNMDLDSLDVEIISEEDQPADIASEADDAPIVKFVNKIILDAVNAGASDIHFEPYEHNYRVRVRLDGLLQETAAPPHSLASKMTSRLKIMSRLNIAERRIPQDGRFKMQLSKTRSIDFRVSTCPTLFGEKVVLRILDPTNATLGIDKLGYEPVQQDHFMEAIEQAQGLVLVTGPTGSGKTVSLYTALNILNTEGRNISTAEDPVEINLPGINQVNINQKAGLNFASTLRAFLRQDPDIIMVGEIRDLETAEIAIKASQTGHMVLSTLHTNSAPETISRLINMGVERFNLASSVTLIIAQRLARKLCDHCKEVMDIPPQALAEFGFTEEQIEAGFEVYCAKGCDKCHQGYKGRIGIFEVVPITKPLQELIMNGGNALEIAALQQKIGINDLRQSGLLKVMAGITTIEEVNRVTTT